MSIKAQALTLLASPLFNGNPDYAGYVDKRGIALFPQEYKKERWDAAAAALKEAIDAAHEAGISLYYFDQENDAKELDSATLLGMRVRGAVTQKWNSEIIWGNSDDNINSIQRLCQPMFHTDQSAGSVGRCWAPTLRVVEQFYSKNGIPIEEDKFFDYDNRFLLKEGDEKHKMVVKEGYRTMQLHFNREPRFYGSISFDGGTFYGNGRRGDENLYIVYLNASHELGAWISDRYSTTGYLCKKLINYKTSAPNNTNGMSYERYAFPIIRLADLYLMYAEALNESKDAPDVAVYEYIDLVRQRAGLKGVVTSWQQFAKDAVKPINKAGMRDIIQRERLNELAFEGARFWDLRRWKLAEIYMNAPIRGLNSNRAVETHDDFYIIQNLWIQHFEVKDYLWPIRTQNLLKNRNLVQNPGW